MARETSGLKPAAGDTRPIGLFDSGVGGLSVWREVLRQLPQESTVYVADQAHIPYGPQPGERLRAYAEGITQWLLARDCKAIVVACNAASAAALKHLRARFPQLPFIGMEPAVKPAATATRSGTVAVLATPATLRGELFAATAQRYAQGARIIGEPCPGLVEQIESGAALTPQTEAMLRGFLAPALAAGADHVVLACTHYPFVIEPIRRIVGGGVEVIDPAPAVVRQLGRVLAERGLAAPPQAVTHHHATTAVAEHYAAALKALLGVTAPVEALKWLDDARLQPRADVVTA